MYDIYGRNGEKIMLLDELKIEQDDLKVGDVVYTSHHPNIGVWVSFRYSKMRKEVIQRITPKRTKIVTDYGEYTNRDHFYKMTDELKKPSVMILLKLINLLRNTVIKGFVMKIC